MPELPEVEGIRRVLGERMTSMRLTRVQVRRVDVIKPIRGRRTAVRASQRKRSLLAGGRVASLLRHGKRLAQAA
ncbi:MAG: DNA-formamidopyrimidine glycosylase family protein, partial [Planctomycetota bacterium]|nr:DNA-formamidopyrimidine glycosylase family protein [Planctomycetota bacterium]